MCYNNTVSNSHSFSIPQLFTDLTYKLVGLSNILIL